ncbi:MAG: hypothetical protein M1133_05175 [Armatimonadetes bacterium]|nr:hypothetical protein [Armatimonadota bacterium]
MIIRRIIIILTALVVAVGVSQLVAPSWWAEIVPNMLESPWSTVFGVIALLYGGLLLVAVAERLIGLRLFVAVIGLLSMAGGIVMLAATGLAQDLVNALITNRAHGFQIIVVWVSGLARTIIGVLVLWAITERPVDQPRNQMPPMG